ncbi:hypothetical protein [Hyalangium versicolor]|uniref:hypothetical protein n=1 Tax=Hyalangium versicolor TaxID=2861190 RepID=UPI001CCD952F|nr:hypothetical protein [Hyalangium versicolor]
MTPSLLLLLLLAQAHGLDAPSEVAPATESAEGWHYLTRGEATTLALLPRGGVGSREGFLQVEPTLVVDGGEEFGLNVGAPVRLWLWGGEAGAGRVRREDWDSLSDWGQLVRALKLGSDASPVALRVGALEGYSLLSGHLVRRYSNRANPDYHPAGAFLTGRRGPLYVEVFASDVLSARLMGVQAEVDLAHVFTGAPPEPGRYTLGLSAVRGWGRAGGESPPVTLAHVDGTAVLVVRPGFELHVLGGWGKRSGEAGAWGAVAGVGADALTLTLDMKLRVEVRRQHGGFRQGYFGPDYELSRWNGVGTSGSSVEPALFPEGFSAYGEVEVGWDGVRLGELLQRHLYLSLAAEVFDWGRVDVDGRLALQVAGRRMEVAVNGLALGLGQLGARHLYSGELRWRFASRLYALVQGGTRLYPRADRTLRPVAFAVFGLGVDNAR